MSTSLVAVFSEQAGFCREFGSPFTGALIDALARDIEDGGPAATLVSQWPVERARADALPLRIVGALHAAVLTGRDAELAAEYPPARADWDGARVWSASRAFLEREREWVAERMRLAPQTNETRRSIALLHGFLTLALRFDLPLDLLELGASAGLNQCWDRFGYHTRSWSWGGASPVRIETDWRGAPPPLDAKPRVRTRAGCDLAPPDLHRREDLLRLRSYVWPDQPERLERFDAAAALALSLGVRPECADAGEWLERRLAARAPDALTVVYHSIFYQYPTRETRARIRAAIESAGRQSAPLAWLRLEPEAALGGPRDSLRIVLDLVTYPCARRETLALTDGHVRFVDTSV